MKGQKRTEEEKLTLLKELYPTMHRKEEKALKILLDLEECSHTLNRLINDGKKLRCLDCGTKFSPEK